MKTQDTTLLNQTFVCKLASASRIFLVADGFEQSELAEPKKALEQEGARAPIVSPSENKVKGLAARPVG